MPISSVSLSDERTAWRDAKAHSVGYFATGPVSAIDESLLAELRAVARATHENARLSLHASPDAAFHEMIIYQHADRIHPPKKHLHKDKSFHIIEGILAVLVFDDAGNLTDCCRLDGKQRHMYRVAAGVYHADIPLTDHVIHHESTTGPFVRATDSVFAPWAPADSDTAGMNAYRDRLAAQIAGFEANAPRILVTGAGGLCGAHLVDRLIADERHIGAVYRRIPDNLSASAYLTPIAADLTAFADLPARIDTIVHTAARLGVPGSSASRIAADNVEATRRLIEYAIGAGTKKFIFLSAMSIYGKVTGASVNEATPIHDPDAYGASKLMGERMLAEYAAELPSLSLRLPSVVARDAQHGWITGLIRRLAAGEPVSYVNPETRFNNLVHADDLAGFIAHLIDAPLDGADIVTLGAAEPMNVGAVVTHLKTCLASTSQLDIRHTPDAPAFVIDSSHASARHGWHPSRVIDILDRLTSN